MGLAVHFDVVHAADPRFHGGTSSALRTELKAANQWGVSCGLLPFLGQRTRELGVFDSRTAAVIEQSNTVWLTGSEEATCDILLAHHPAVFERMPRSPVRLQPRRVVCVVHHPLFDGNRVPQYDLGVVERVLDRLFGVPVVFAPVGPKVRSQFDSIGTESPALLRHDLWNMVDLAEWASPQRTAPTGTVNLGRHTRADPAKWPSSADELRAAYPDTPNFAIKVLGGAPTSIQPWIGSNWQISPFAQNSVPDFLRRLDFYVYFHSPQWVEAFGVCIAEAMASGLVTVLDPSFEGLFEGGAVYCNVAETRNVIERFVASPSTYLQQSNAARELVRRKFAIDQYSHRMARLCDDLELSRPPALKCSTTAGKCHLTGEAAEDKAPRSLPRRMGKKRRILFVATNGIGLGHITRLMAIAERLPDDTEPIFFTRSSGSALAYARGHAVDYTPSGLAIGVTDDSWNRAYAQELLTAVEAFDVSAVVFDGNRPFPGLIAVAECRRDLAWFWIRRALWRLDHDFDPGSQDIFDMVIEPGEFAHDEDHGPTRDMPGTVAVPPVLLLDPGTGLPRSEAASKLGVDPGRFTVAVQLGSQRNFDLEDLPGLIFAGLVRRNIQTVQILNPLAKPSKQEWPGVLRTSVYPLAEYVSAIDLLVTTAGYNSFHESILGGIPSIFVPNEAPEMDDQHLRAVYAQTTGLGLCLRYSELDRVETTLDLALSEAFRTEVRRRLARLSYVNGAAMAANAIEQLVFSIRADRPLHASIARR
ncbi:UDP:flavonoid glycosyltransferase YjiC, YdhE family [Rhizobium mongolense subsp. loessense]|uniref:UDP:flavonoid glycosyltransferase YjiC, YdhE family n=1 Tax=Rhizobium mongolense subsp. loessense TaxID=158890 RepID=A0A1G4TNB6_9HYPH|nr:glycosyltransferase [Rhizobium mongolense]SCW82822.1 UDP:flavonoid glycosyltransferase YjiC, YdhE family [Rhizobium mongolense subsp. loessense]